jgi:hypothetical protein
MMRGGDLAAARAHLATAFRMIDDGERGLGFLGAQLYGLKALLTEDVSTLQATLADGQALLVDGALSHNHFIFYDFATQACIGCGRWAEALRYCVLLDTYTAAEPFAWADFVSARGRALVRHGQGERSAELLVELRRLSQLAVDRQMNYYRTAIDDALAECAGTDR